MKGVAMITLKINTIIPVLLLALVAVTSCKPSQKGTEAQKSMSGVPEIITVNAGAEGVPLQIEFVKGSAHNHPTFAFWLADENGKYLQTLFVTRALGQGVFTYGDKTGGKWKPGEVRRPAALPVWSHARGIRAADGLFVPDAGTRVPDACSGATPKGSFSLETKAERPLAGRVKLMFEINQTWDWNQYWSNDKYPDNRHYKTSCQPSLVYEAELDLSKPGSEVELKPVGHGHYAGEDGTIYPDLSTLTTAKQIALLVKAKVL